MKREIEIKITTILLIIPILFMSYACKEKNNKEIEKPKFEKFQKLKGTISLRVVSLEDEGFSTEEQNIILSIAKSMNQTGNEFTLAFPLDNGILSEMTDASKVRIESDLFNQDFMLMNPERQLQGRIKPDQPLSFLRLYSGLNTDLEEVNGVFTKTVNGKTLSLQFEDASLINLNPQLDHEGYTQNIQAAYIENAQEGLHFYFEMSFKKSSLKIAAKSHRIDKIQAVISFKEKTNENENPDVIDPEKN